LIAIAARLPQPTRAKNLLPWTPDFHTSAFVEPWPWVDIY